MTDAASAKYLELLNRSLAEEDDRLTGEFTRPSLPVTFLSGLPRAGKTLLHQAIATSLDVGYVSNLLNKFWRAPYLGACLERDLLRDTLNSSFHSDYGNTRGMDEPGEWGWFWRHWLGLASGAHHASSEMDLSPLLAKLAGLEKVKGKPLLFNNMYAVSSMPALHARLPDILLIDKPRDPYWVCNSIINARVARYGDVNAFFANRPRDMTDIARQADDAVEEVVLQVKALLREAEDLRAMLGPDRVFTVDYERFLQEPCGVLEELRQFWGRHGLSVAWTGRSLPTSFEDRNKSSLIDPAYRELLDRHFARHFATGSMPQSVRSVGSSSVRFG